MAYKDPEYKKKYNREYYKRRYADPEFREFRRQQMKAHHRLVRANRRALIDESKSGGCVVCGETELCCLDHHHLDDDAKRFHVSQFKGWGRETLIAEIAKCVVLCSNCHRKFHAGVIELPGREAVA